MRRRQQLRNERGAVLVLVAAALPMMILFGIFVIDVGNWWVHKRHLQTQADAAALAGAREWRIPGCNDQPIVETAVDYSGGVLSDPDLNYSGYDPTPEDYNYQLAASARPNGPTQGIHTVINRPNPFERTTSPPVDPDLDASPPPKPCAAGFLDVKMTETDIAGRFSPLRFLNVLGFVEYIDAHARVNLFGLETTSGLLPLGVEDINPKRVHIWIYDEITGAELGEAELNPRAPEDGLLMFDNSSAGGGTPVAINMKRETLDLLNVTKERLGVKVALSASDSINCGDNLVKCYGSSAEGITRIRGHRTWEGPTAASCSNGTDDDGDGSTDSNDIGDCRGVRLGEVAIVKDAARCANTAYGTHDNGYFSTTCTGAVLKVALPGLDGSRESADNIKVTANIQTGNNTSSVDLHYVAGSGYWETTGTDRIPIDLQAGSRRISIDWSQRANNSTLDMGGATPAVCKSAQNQNPCKDRFADAHKAFSGSRDNAGPIKEVRVDVDGITNVNNVTRCGANQNCTANFVVRIGVAGRLELSPPGSPPVALRVSGDGEEGHQTQQLNCDPSKPTTDDEIAFGCTPTYTLNTGDACPKRPILWLSPQPWDCVALKTGTINGPVSKGMNERVLCAPANSAGNCSGFGKPTACTNPNNYDPNNDGVPDYDDGDPRILHLFLVPFGTFDVIGADETVPVIDFAFFYVTGWRSKGGGFDNPCDTPGQDPPEEFAPGTNPTDQGVISGYFIKYVAPNTGGSGTGECNQTSIGGCVAVLTK